MAKNSTFTVPSTVTTRLQRDDALRQLGDTIVAAQASSFRCASAVALAWIVGYHLQDDANRPTEKDMREQVASVIEAGSQSKGRAYHYRLSGTGQRLYKLLSFGKSGTGKAHFGGAVSLVAGCKTVDAALSELIGYIQQELKLGTFDQMCDYVGLKNRSRPGANKGAVKTDADKLSAAVKSAVDAVKEGDAKQSEIIPAMVSAIPVDMASAFILAEADKLDADTLDTLATAIMSLAESKRQAQDARSVVEAKGPLADIVAAEQVKKARGKKQPLHA